MTTPARHFELWDAISAAVLNALNEGIEPDEIYYHVEELLYEDEGDD